MCKHRSKIINLSGFVALLSLLTGCSNSGNPLQSEATDQTVTFSEEKRIKPDVEPAKELDIQCFEPAKVNGLAKTSHYVYSFSNCFGIYFQPNLQRQDWGTFFYGNGKTGLDRTDGTAEDIIYRGTFPIGFNPSGMVGQYNQQDVDMLKTQLKWCIDYYNKHSNTGVKFAYSDNNYWMGVYFYPNSEGHIAGGVSWHTPINIMQIGLPTVRDAINKGWVNLLREMIMHEMGHIFGADHIDDPYSSSIYVPGTPSKSNPNDDPNSIMWSHRTMWSTQPDIEQPILTTYDIMSFHYGLDNRFGLNHGLDYAVNGNKIDGTNWKNFVIGDYEGDIWTTGSDQLEWIYSSPSDAQLPSGSFDDDAVMSGCIKDNQQTWMGIKFNTQTDGTKLHFKYRVESELYYDFFEVHYWIGGRSTTRIFRTSGNVGWRDLTLELPSAADCRVIFYYTKDGSVSSGSDRVYIDHPYLSN